MRDSSILFNQLGKGLPSSSRERKLEVCTGKEVRDSGGMGKAYGEDYKSSGKVRRGRATEEGNKSNIRNS